MSVHNTVIGGHCAACGAAADPGAAFCGSCGHDLSADAATQPPLPRRRRRRGLRTVAAVLVAVLVGCIPPALIAFGPSLARPATVSAEQMGAISAAAQAAAPAGTDPASRPALVTVSGADVTNGRAPAGKTVRLTATLARSEGLASDGRALALADGSAVTPAYYLGGGDFKQGDRLLVTGEVVNGVLRADDISVLGGTSSLQPLLDDPWLSIERLAWATAADCVLFLLATLDVLIRKKRGYLKRQARIAATLAAAVIVALLLSGCSVDVHAVVREDGSGTLSTKLVLPDELGNLADLPNADSYVRAWQQRMSALGTVVRHDGATFELQREFSNPDDLTRAGAGGRTGFTNLRIVRRDGQTRYVFTARVDTTQLYATETSGTDQASADQLRQQLDGAQMTYALDLPGNVTFANGDRSGSRVTWPLKMNGVTDLRAESVVGDPAESPYLTSFVLWSAALWLLAVASFVIFAVAFAWYAPPTEADSR